ncbi:MAG: glycosyltransferase family 2 protein [Alphaproteobacteria bacterium]|nr:glycosyltransferase family 2 protein [Alphaproteobacteria bacterium]
MPGASQLSIVTVSWMSGPSLKDAIEAVLATPSVGEYILVSHENPPETLAMLRDMAAEHDHFTLIETGENLGFAKGCNIGAKRATGDVILFLNPDALINEEAAAALKASAGRMHLEDWVIGARILNDDGTEQRGGRRGELTPLSAMAGFLNHNSSTFGRDAIHMEKRPVPAGLSRVPTVSGAAMMVPRAAFLARGGFDEQYFLHVEDIDMCRQVREAGGEVFIEPRANILHYGGTSRSSPLFVETHKASGFVKYFWKFYPGPLERLMTALAIIPIYAAIWGRVWYYTLANQLSSTKADGVETTGATVHDLKAHRRAREAQRENGDAAEN